MGIIAVVEYRICRPSGANGSVVALRKAGKFNWSSPEIDDDHFPGDPSDHEGENVVSLAHIGHGVSVFQAIAAITEARLQPAPAWATLALGGQHPNLQLEFPIVGLGTPWREPFGHWFALLLGGMTGRRFATLTSIGYGFHGDVRFACIRLPSSG